MVELACTLTLFEKVLLPLSVLRIPPLRMMKLLKVVLLADSSPRGIRVGGAVTVDGNAGGRAERAALASITPALMIQLPVPVLRC